MTQVDKSKQPFYDTYDEDNQYHEVLFVPRAAVQTRELNELQSMFLNKVEKFADHVFEEGSIVLPGNISYDLRFDYVTVDFELPETFSNFAEYVKQNEVHVISYNTGLKGKIVRYEPQDGDDPQTLYVQYLNGGNTNDDKTFTDLETVRLLDVTSGSDIVNADVITTGTGSKITVSNGVYYLNGRFVLVPEQTIPLDKYSNNPTKTVGFEYMETVVSALDDNSLYDNAQGTSNFSAPGASRLKVDAVLTAYSNESEATDDFIEIFRIEEGRLQSMARGPSYNILGDTLAKRTYDESGNYEVEGFPLYVREHLREDKNQGVYTASNGGEESKFVSQIGSGLAYVKGYEVSILSTQNIEHNKARSSEVSNNYSLSVQLGYYIEADSITNLPDLTEYESVDFLDGASSTIGTGRVKSVSYFNGKYRIYLFDVRNTSGVVSTSFVSDIRTISGSSFDATVLADDASLRGTDNSASTFELSYEYVKSLINPLTSESDTSFSVIRQYNTSTDASGEVILSAPINGTFLSQNSIYSYASFTDTTNDVVDISSISSLGGTPSGKTLTVSFGSGNENRPVRINVLTSIDEAITKTKSVSTSSVTSSVVNGQVSLNKADAIRITSVTDDQLNDVTELFSLIRNVRKSYYDISYVTTTSTFSNPVTVEFEYFSHSTGDYFCVDSYAGIDYADIPVENGVRVSDILDFRPRISDDGQSFVGAGSSRVIAPAPDTLVRIDLEYYLPRRDRIVVNENSELKVVEGNPGLDPEYPSTPSNTMALYQLDIPAYTLDVEEIQVNKVSTPRYTMNDISKLEDRIDNIDYYLTLNMLEKDAADMQIVDPVTGLNRYKNGFLVDPFSDHTVGDANWNEYHCSIGDGDLRPELRFNAVDFGVDETTMSNVTVNNGVLTLAYDEQVFLDQQKRSEYMNVNPYAVFRWEGEIVLDPSVDNWVDVVYTTPRVIRRTVTRTRRITNPSQSWSNNATVLNSSYSTDITPPPGKVYNPSVAQAGTTFNFNKTQELRKTSSSSSTRSGGTKVIDNEWLPFMRSREVEVHGEGHKPETKLNFFFDDIPVNEYIRPVNGSLGDRIVTDNEGSFEAVFNIPNNDELQIPVGTKMFVATDIEETRRELALSWGETDYTATSRRETRQRTIVRTRIRTITRATSTRTNTFTITPNPVKYHDPLAQSFLVEQNGGIFVTKLDLYFLSKDQNIPVHVDIREMENGQPTQNVVTGSRTMLKSSEVIETEDGSTPSTFKFKYPVYLEQGREYCVVIWANSVDYNVWVARMGEKDLGTNKYIAKQPYLGVLFKSQNTSTWTEDQNADLQFTLHRAIFNTNGGSVTLRNKELPKIKYNKQVLYSTDGSSTVSLMLDKHNFVEGSVITIEGAVSGNGFDSSDLNGSHTITEVVGIDEVKFEITSSTTANATGMFGGREVEVSDSCLASFFSLNCTDVTYSDTSIQYTATGMTGQSIGGSEIPYQNISDSVELEKNNLISLKQPWLITNKNDEQANFSGNSSMSVVASLFTDNKNISPVIDMDSYNVICPFYMIDGDLDSVEPDGSNSYAKYRTQIAGLSSPATSIRVFVDTAFDENSDVVLSCRVGSSEDEVEDGTWTQLPLVDPRQTTNGQVTELEYFLEESDGLPEYTYFQVMIQLKSNNAARVPICRNLRVIALGT